MQVHITMNVFDLDRLVREAIAARNPNMEVTGYTVVSFKQTVLHVADEKIDFAGVRHRLHPDHARIKVEL